MNFHGPARRLTAADFGRAGASIGVGEDEIRAVLEVESSGSGFDRQGRPKMLFEPHVFYRCLPQHKRQAAVSRGLAYPKWKPGAYPKDSYPRLIEAMEIDATAALKAASWGLGQILGENYAAAGHAMVQAMVLECTLGEAEQLRQMIAFIKAKGLDRHLRNHDWTSFARGYNGAQFAKHNYHGRLANAFARWQAKPDTDWRAAAEEDDAKAPPVPQEPVPLPPDNPTSDTARDATATATGFAGLIASVIAFLSDNWELALALLIGGVAVAFIIRKLWR